MGVYSVLTAACWLSQSHTTDNCRSKQGHSEKREREREKGERRERERERARERKERRERERARAPAAELAARASPGCLSPGLRQRTV